MAAAPGRIQFELPGREFLDQERFRVIPTLTKAIVRIAAMTAAITEEGELFLYDCHSSGFILEGGFIVTTAHGILDRNCEQIGNVGIGEEEPYDFRPRVLILTHVGDSPCLGFQIFPVAIDTGIDLALLSLPPCFSVDSYFSLADQQEAAKGKSLITIGHPIEFPFAMRFSSVSHPCRILRTCVPNPTTTPGGFYLIEVDKVAPRGFSGGPQVTNHGAVLAVNHCKFELDSNLVSLCVPVQFLRELLLWHSANPGELFPRGDGQRIYHRRLIMYGWRTNGGNEDFVFRNYRYMP